MVTNARVIWTSEFLHSVSFALPVLLKNNLLHLGLLQVSLGSLKSDMPLPCQGACLAVGVCLSLQFSFSVLAVLQGELWSLSNPGATTVCQHHQSKAGFTKNLTPTGYNLSHFRESPALPSLLCLLPASMMAWWQMSWADSSSNNLQDGLRHSSKEGPESCHNLSVPASWWQTDRGSKTC